MSEEIQKSRSPNSPKFELNQSIDLAKKLYDKIGRSAVKAEVAAGALGYGGLNGAALATLGAISQYGLVERSAGNVQITPLAIKILHPVDAAGKAAALKEAALSPRVFAEIFEKSPDMSEEVLANHLIHQNFTPDAAKRAAAVYKANSALANLGAASSILPDQAKSTTHEAEKKSEQPSPSRSDSGLDFHALVRPKMLATFKIPLGLAEAELIFTGEKLEEADFDALAEYVGLFKKQYARKMAATVAQIAKAEAVDPQQELLAKIAAVDLATVKR